MLFITLTNGLCYSQNSILVNPAGNPRTDLSAAELIEEVFIDNDNITFDESSLIVKGDSGAADVRSWGYFEKGDTNFPFESGIVLTTGIAKDAEAPNEGPGSGFVSFDSVGDNDIKIILDETNRDNFPTFDVTSFEFDFVPDGDLLKFDFIFASEEYENDYECDSSVRDGFAFLIKGPGIPNTSGTPFGGKNIASVPGSNNIVVNTGSIHADLLPNGTPFRCGTEVLGTNFFPDLYVSNDGPNNTDIMEYDGFTKVLNTQTLVQSGETYRIKFIIADRGDSLLDSAVFLRALTVNSNVKIVDKDDSELDFEICAGEVATLTAKNISDPYSGSETYQWELDDVVLAGKTTPTISIDQGGKYKVTVTDLGKKFVDTINVTLAVFNAGDDAEISFCSGEGTTQNLFDLLGSDADSGGTWSPELDSKTGVFDPSIDAAGVYTYTVGGSSKCDKDTATVTVVVVTSPSLALVNTECAKNRLSYNVNFETNGTWEISTTPSGLGRIDVTNSKITEIPTDTDFTIIAINKADIDCEVTLDVKAPNCNCPVVPLPVNPSNQIMCYGATIPNLSVALLAGQTANWYSVDDELLLENSPTYTPVETEVGIYIFRVKAVDIDTQCLSDAVEASLLINDIPEITLEPSSVCVDESGNIISADLPVIDTQLNPSEYSFEWKYKGQVLSEKTAAITVDKFGAYEVTYTNSIDCSKSARVVVNKIPSAKGMNLSLSSGKFSATNDIIATLISPEGGYMYSLNDGPLQENNVFKNVSLGLHTVTATSIDNCGSFTEDIFNVGFPNFFTPNNDGKHDHWNVIANFDIPEMQIFIFDRYGMFIRSLNANEEGWNGKYNLHDMPADDYWFTAKFVGESEEYKGHFSLIR